MKLALAVAKIENIHYYQKATIHNKKRDFRPQESVVFYLLEKN